jgi:proteic killer suppression protein
VIGSFGSKDTEALANGKRVKRFASFERAAQRKLAMLAAATSLADLRVPPANRLEKLSGNRDGEYSIRINDQWRICFEWNDGAHNVEIVDYH